MKAAIRLEFFSRQKEDSRTNYYWVHFNLRQCEKPD